MEFLTKYIGQQLYPYNVESFKNTFLFELIELFE
jgi:hypothetical protein